MKNLAAVSVAAILSVLVCGCNNTNNIPTGPMNLSGWQLTGFPAFDGGFTVAGADFVGGSQGIGVYLSTNAGANWTSISQSLPLTGLRTLGSQNSILFAGGTEGVYLTTDLGSHWNAADSGMTTGPNQSSTPPTISTILVRGSSIFAGSFGSGIFLSINGGVSWTPVDSGLTTNTIVYCMTVADSQIFAGTNYGVHRSTNNGISWIRSNNGLESTLVTRIITRGSTIFAATMTAGVFASSDGGITWISRDNGLSGIPYGTVNAIASIDTDVFVGTDSGLFMSTDNGMNWGEITAGLPATNIQAMIVIGRTLLADVYDSSTNIVSVWARMF